ncbi:MULTISPECIES: YodC family protein [Sphingobacterium]|uniref:YodC family protein n=1 Tax=Sphingobacterium TaxID=28453 RepID=UPI00257F801A|nr:MULTISPECIES: DUF2158 domain-containing protein [Sphingobacterium]
MEEIKVGDVVQLKSGGVKMTVEEITEDQDNKTLVTCCWFNGGEYKSEKIYLVALKKYKAPSISVR